MRYFHVIHIYQASLHQMLSYFTRLCRKTLRLHFNDSPSQFLEQVTSGTVPFRSTVTICHYLKDTHPSLNKMYHEENKIWLEKYKHEKMKNVNKDKQLFGTFALGNIIGSVDWTCFVLLTPGVCLLRIYFVWGWFKMV